MLVLLRGRLRQACQVQQDATQRGTSFKNVAEVRVKSPALPQTAPLPHIHTRRPIVHSIDRPQRLPRPAT